MSKPRWRYVRYTDDGCALYQCLNCYKQWESRTAPGWYDTTMFVEGPCEGSRCFTQIVDGEPELRYYVDRTIPLYRPEWHYCPYCAINWEGPIRCDVDNEYMLGPSRLVIKRAVDQWYIDNRHKCESPVQFWWVIQERTIWVGGSAGEWSGWCDKEYAKGLVMPVAKMLYLLRDYQARLDRENNNDEHRFCDYEVRLITKHSKPAGYEIRNYDREQ